METNPKRGQIRMRNVKRTVYREAMVATFNSAKFKFKTTNPEENTYVCNLKNKY